MQGIHVKQPCTPRKSHAHMQRPPTLRLLRTQLTCMQCGWTGAPNEVWHYGNTAYQSIRAVMELRESIRPCVIKIMKVANRTGTPALRPIFLEFPNDEGLETQGEKLDGEFMFGLDYLLLE